jgi:hypothetical protein
MVIRRVCTSGQRFGTSRYGSIPGKGECIITHSRVSYGPIRSQPRARRIAGAHSAARSTYGTRMLWMSVWLTTAEALHYPWIVSPALHALPVAGV